MPSSRKRSHARSCWLTLLSWKSREMMGEMLKRDGFGLPAQPASQPCRPICDMPCHLTHCKLTRKGDGRHLSFWASEMMPCPTSDHPIRPGPSSIWNGHPSTSAPIWTLSFERGEMEREREKEQVGSMGHGTASSPAGPMETGRQGEGRGRGRGRGNREGRELKSHQQSDHKLQSRIVK